MKEYLILIQICYLKMTITKLFLENIRFYEEEEKIVMNLQKFYLIGKHILMMPFCSHRACPVDKITKFLPSYCGIQMNSLLL